MDPVDKRLENCFSAVFPGLSRDEIRRCSQASVPEWDSVNAITLLTVIEEEFRIQVEPEAAAELFSFPLVLDYLKNRPDVSCILLP